MILHIDHIAVSSINFEKNIKFLESLGYKKKFLQKNIKNLDIKRNFLKKFSFNHDLALLDLIGNFSIEIISYGHKMFNNSCFIPLVENSKCCFFPNSLNVLESNYQNDSFFKFNKIFVRVKNIEKALKFWSVFGFKFIKRVGIFFVLSFKSLLNKCEYYLYLQESLELNTNFYLDDLGFNSLSFITTSAEKERELISKKGIETTKIEQLFLNDKLLNIFFAKSENGKIIEFISFG